MLHSFYNITRTIQSARFARAIISLALYIFNIVKTYNYQELFFLYKNLKGEKSYIFLYFFIHFLIFKHFKNLIKI